LTRENEELNFVREENNLELVEIEKSRHNLTQENSHLISSLDLVRTEKNALLDYIKEWKGEQSTIIQDLEQ
jgi:uncharacterized coiled-coil DUF342 family protein